ncbi:MAG: N-6 DNA methylase [Cytophagales bacterium]|nr:N-6 DNA methylase [Cytophagales bacterium]
MEILHKIVPNAEIDIPMSTRYFDKLEFYEKEKGKWYLKSFDSEEKEKLVLNEETGKKAPEEIVRQLFLYELIQKYGYPKERIKIEQKVVMGRDEKKRADIVVYQNDNATPWIISEVKAPHQKNNIQQLKGYLNAEGSPIGAGYNGKNLSIYARPYPKEFDVLRDLPFEHEYQTAKDDDNLIRKIKELISDRKWTLDELNKINKEKHFDLKAIIEELEELVLANSGADSFDEIFKLIYTKLYDEFEAENRENQTLSFRDYSNPKITHDRISQLFEESKDQWKDIFEVSDRIKLTPEHLEICIGKLTEVKLYGANLRIIDEAFEYLVPEVSKSKKGQYFTPRIVIDTCVKMLNPTRKEYILDPACGSAGFLVHAMEYIWDKYKMESYKVKANYANKYLWGVDFEEKATKISKALMLIAGDGKTHIYKQNTLEYSKWSESFKVDLKREALLDNENPKNLTFDIIMSNPPFA